MSMLVLDAELGNHLDEPQAGDHPAAIVDRFLHNVLNGGQYGPGDRLPTERAIAQTLGLPRSAVRNALSRWEAHGRIARVMGSGTYVAETRVRTPNLSAEASPLEIMEARLMIEPRMARLIVGHATTSDLDRIQACLEATEQAPTFEAFEIKDAQLHQHFADATHNPLVIAIYAAVTASRDQTEWGDLKRRTITASRRSAYDSEHREIVAALRSRDAVRAEEAVDAHLRTIRHNLLGF